MKFRQRLAWLVALGYLGGSFFVLYYLFEINEKYNKFALDHVNYAHKQQGDQSKSADSAQSDKSRTLLWQHLVDIPVGVWFVILIVPYIQIFFMILACTRAEPMMSYAFLWPGIIYLKYQEIVHKLCHKNNAHMKSINSTVYTNGNSVLHT